MVEDTQSGDDKDKSRSLERRPVLKRLVAKTPTRSRFLRVPHSDGIKLLREYYDMDSMNDAKLQKKIQIYINIFRNFMSKILSPEIGQQIKTVGFRNGVLMEIELSPNLANSDRFFMDVDKLSTAFNAFHRKPFKDVKICAELKDNKAIKNTFIEIGDTIIIAKGKNNNFWSVEQAHLDIDAILETVAKRGAKKMM